jgi:hypothetical protein
MKLYLLGLQLRGAGGSAVIAAESQEGARRVLDETQRRHIDGWVLTETLDSLPTAPTCLLLEAFAHQMCPHWAAQLARRSLPPPHAPRPRLQRGEGAEAALS